MAYCEGILYCSNSKKIYLLDVYHNLAAGEIRKIELDTVKQVRVITPGIPIHALFNYNKGVVVAMETDDSQIDFSQLVPTPFAVKNFSY